MEAIVALVLVGIAALSLGGAAAAATAMLREAALEQGATLEAESALDSLVQVFASAGSAPAAGIRIRAPWTLEWSVADSGGVGFVDLSVRYSSGSAIRSLRFGRRVARPPLDLPPLP